ncbi:MAG: hypothetical protein ACFCU5_10740 [Pleurocapsa sp.]
MLKFLTLVIFQGLILAFVSYLLAYLVYLPKNEKAIAPLSAQQKYY